MAATTLNGEKQQTLDIEATEDKPKKSNPLMKKLEPQMIRRPYPVELMGGKIINSDQLCYQRMAGTIFEPLDFETEKECIDFTRAAWRWKNAAEERQQQELVDDLVARAKGNQKLLEKLKEELDLL